MHGLSRRPPLLIASDTHGSRVKTKKDLGAICSSLTATAALACFFISIFHAHALEELIISLCFQVGLSNGYGVSSFLLLFFFLLLDI